jgi:hypothetical protein
MVQRADRCRRRRERSSSRLMVPRKGSRASLLPGIGGQRWSSTQGSTFRWTLSPCASTLRGARDRLSPRSDGSHNSSLVGAMLSLSRVFYRPVAGALVFVLRRPDFLQYGVRFSGDCHFLSLGISAAALRRVAPPSLIQKLDDLGRFLFAKNRKLKVQLIAVRG